MQGASCCTFRYRYDAPPQAEPPAPA